jgi:hypothetical protein
MFDQRVGGGITRNYETVHAAQARTALRRDLSIPDSIVGVGGEFDCVWAERNFVFKPAVKINPC